MTATLNFNIGVLGHVDSGKTSLAQSLSTIASTAAFDKNPQSKERGITLDLGFSSFSVESPDHLKTEFQKVQYTLVDCPGHASLIRTVIGGAQIIDLMFLVIDAGKGMQTQTAECLILGEITCSTMIVILNKIDTFPHDTREKSIEKLTKKMRLTLSKTKFKDAAIVAVAAKPSSDKDTNPIGLNELIDTLKKLTFHPDRSDKGSLLFAVDHCFSIRGQGTVMTGTVLQGSVTVNDNVEISSLKEVRKVKSIQMFKKSVNKAIQGDRVGVCVTQFDSSLLERGLVCTPGSLPTAFAAIISISKIPYFKGSISTKSKFHISMGHETVCATLTLFGGSNIGNVDKNEDLRFDTEYCFVESLDKNENDEKENVVSSFELFALLEFERPVVIAPKSKVLGSNLNTDIHSNSCRLAFQGKILHHYEDKAYRTKDLSMLKIYKFKEKLGVVERLNNDYELIGKNMFKKETNIQCFVGLKVTLSTGETGQLEGTFGQSGKFKIRLLEPLKQTTLDLVDTKKKIPKEVISVTLKFKRYIFDKTMTQ